MQVVVIFLIVEDTRINVSCESCLRKEETLFLSVVRIFFTVDELSLYLF